MQLKVCFFIFYMLSFNVYKLSDQLKFVPKDEKARLTLNTSNDTTFSCKMCKAYQKVNEILPFVKIISSIYEFIRKYFKVLALIKLLYNLLKYPV